jgi:hypothetical protein
MNSCKIIGFLPPLTQRDRLEEAINIDTCETRRDRRLKGGGRQVMGRQVTGRQLMYAELDKELKEWILGKIKRDFG